MKLVWKSTSVQLLIISEKTMAQTVPIEKFHNIFNVGDKLDWIKYRALQYTATNCYMIQYGHIMWSHNVRWYQNKCHRKQMGINLSTKLSLLLQQHATYTNLLTCSADSLCKGLPISLTAKQSMNNYQRRS